VFLNLRAWLQVWLLGLLTKFRVILTIMFIGPFAGLLLADWGASVLRIDRSVDAVNPGPTADVLNRRKSSIAVNLKSPAAIALIKDLVKHVDVVIDPFRPGVLERLGLSPEDVLLPLNERLIIGRMTGFRREGKYAQMAGHDINYIAVSGVLSLLGRKGRRSNVLSRHRASLVWTNVNR
jgi:alpha-methylacyl-CoA racemase